MLRQHTIASLLALLASIQAEAFTVSAMVGGGAGALSRKADETVQGASFLGLLGFDMFGLNLHAFTQHFDLAYSFNDESYAGVYDLLGVGLGIGFGSEGSGRTTFYLQAPLSGTYAVVTESSSLINDATYRYSELTVLEGGQAGQVLVGYEFLKIGRGGDRGGENAYFGLFLGYLLQSFAKQTITIRSNDTDLAPPSPGQDEVSYTMAIGSLHFSVSFEM